MDFYSSEVWFVIGLICVVLEVMLGLTIVVFFFALAAFSMGFLLFFELTSFEDHLVQLATFCAMTLGWAIVLWKPLKRFKNKPLPNAVDSSGESVHVEKFENYIGQNVTISGKDLKRGEIGTATWSGTTVNVSIDPKAEDDLLTVNSVATVVEVKNNIFIVN